MSKELTYSDVSLHSTREDLYMVIEDKVYDVSSFVDEHPGGEEVLMDVAGKDASDAFNDVGHSDEAREILGRLLVGDLKRLDTDEKPKSVHIAKVATSTTSSGVGTGLYIFILLGGVAAYGAYKYIQSQEGQNL